MKNHQLLIKADNINSALVSDEIEFQKIAKELAAQSLFIDEGDLDDRKFALESLLREYEFWHKYPFAILQTGFIFDDTEEYKKIWTKYYGHTIIYKFKKEYEHELVCDFIEILEKSTLFDSYEIERVKNWIIERDNTIPFPKFKLNQNQVIKEILDQIWIPGKLN